MNFEVTLSEAKTMIKALAAKESILLLSAPGVGKSDIVKQAALEVGLKLNSLLGTQIAPEDVSGIPKIINERSVFCPPRILLPEDIAPFCLFLDELPAASPDVQKALYALLLERRLGEHLLPSGSMTDILSCQGTSSAAPPPTTMTARTPSPTPQSTATQGASLNECGLASARQWQVGREYARARAIGADQQACISPDRLAGSLAPPI